MEAFANQGLTFTDGAIIVKISSLGTTKVLWNGNRWYLCHIDKGGSGRRSQIKKLRKQEKWRWYHKVPFKRCKHQKLPFEPAFLSCVKVAKFATFELKSSWSKTIWGAKKSSDVPAAGAIFFASSFSLQESADSFLFSFRMVHIQLEISNAGRSLFRNL